MKSPSGSDKILATDGFDQPGLLFCPVPKKSVFFRRPNVLHVLPRGGEPKQGLPAVRRLIWPVLWWPVLRRPMRPLWLLW